MTTTEYELEAELKHMFASAWQDGVNHLNPKYLRRDTLFTERAMKLIMSLLNTELDKQRSAYRADIAQAIGYCQGLGHPDNYLEKRYLDIASLKENI